MGSGSRVVLCKTSSSLNLFAPAAFTASHLSFKSFLLSSPATNSRLHHNHRMATEASSSASSVNDGDNVIPSLANDAAPSSSSSAIDFLSLCHSLKKTKRAGWIKRDVKNPESIADHMYRMGLMALIAPDIPGIDRDKCVKMAIVHDIAEAIVGDITPSDGIPKEEKSRKEREALDHMCKLLGGGLRAKEISQLWMEYEENSSPEAKIVKDFDKVEMILQALEYENEQDRDLDEFFQSTAGKFQTEVGKAWALEIASRRKKSH
ncbi:5'-deoxynucleotidase HDDC2 isoform X1 [Ricinus communis]|uniref:5'-deoxynucleotidase HDDC2 isoform X1 n=1 Tax=Ricinus communis TaxID=3988 RepID=UPI00201A3A6E|nr:5'-deoxynucleotidase HDDC2 isoform X1 [Ricinus communis]XP_015583992.2 5'-deoxynucleotidase HDDC2 isoform X1 [Ricinus communis]